MSLGRLTAHAGARRGADKRLPRPPGEARQGKGVLGESAIRHFPHGYRTRHTKESVAIVIAHCARIVAGDVDRIRPDGSGEVVVVCGDRRRGRPVAHLDAEPAAGFQAAVE